VGVDQPIVTGEAVALELRPAGVGSRGIAFVIDLIVQFLVTIGWVWAVSQAGGSDDAAVAAVILTLVVATVLGYPVAFEALWRGRTPGKAVMGLRVVRDDGGPIRFRHAFVRGLVGVVVDRPGFSSGLLALVPMLATRRSKRLGDLAAGTVVVQDRVPSRIAPAPTVAAELQSWAAGLDLTGISDGLAMEIRAFLGRARQLTPKGREDLGNQLLARLEVVVAPRPAAIPPWTFLETVLAERTRRATEQMSAQRGYAPPPAEPATPPPAGPFAPPS